MRLKYEDVLFDFTVNCNSPLVCGGHNPLLQKVEDGEFVDCCLSSSQLVQ